MRKGESQLSVESRVVLIVLDSVGAGELPDAPEYGDEGSNTLRNTAAAVGGLELPELGRLGLGRILPIPGVAAEEWPQGAWGRMAERSAGKDTTTGHWEISGVILERPFPTYPHGFPPDVIEPFEQAIGRRVIGNKPASGTQIIETLGPQHTATGSPIVYTSADSVFQIAAHEEVIPPERLYEMCQIARRFLAGRHAVGRVIARPFTGRPGAFRRTERRRDFSLPPPGETILDRLHDRGFSVRGVGKIEDIFAGRGLSRSIHAHNNMEAVDATLAFLHESPEPGLIFTNLVDFDMIWGHRNDPQGYARGLEAFDRRLPEVRAAMAAADVLILTADHGCDPTTPSTDHSREYVPLLVYGRRLSPGVDLGTRATYADVAATIADLFGVGPFGPGESFWPAVADRSGRADR